MSVDREREFRLVAACCRWPLDLAAIRHALDRAGTDFDHDRLVDVVLRHRVAALVKSALASAGVSLAPVAAARLAKAAGATSRTALGQARATLVLATLFDAADIPAVFFKGAALAAVAYGDLGVKHAKDIDVLIAERDVERTLRLLIARGYAPERDVGLNDDRLDRHVAYFKDLTLVDASAGVALELHWRLFQNGRLLPGVSLDSPRRDVVLGGQAVPTFADAPLYAYLCVHGALTGWARLKWLADLLALIRSTGTDPRALHQAAAALGAARSSALALVLCERRLGLDLDPAFKRFLRRDPIVRLLAANADRALMLGDGRQEIDDYSPQWWRTYFSALILKPDLRYSLRQVVLYAQPIDSLIWTRLPRPLHFLLYLARVPSWIIGRLKRRAPDPA